VFDYQVAYEMVKRENESLSQTILKLNRDLDETSRVSTCWLFFVLLFCYFLMGRDDKIRVCVYLLVFLDGPG